MCQGNVEIAEAESLFLPQIPESAFSLGYLLPNVDTSNGYLVSTISKLILKNDTHITFPGKFYPLV